MDWIKAHKVWSGVIALVAIVVIVAIAGGGNKKEDNKTTETTTPAATSQQTPTPPKEEKKFVFDVPSLLGKNIDQIRKVLGSPEDGNLTEPNKAQKELGVTEWDNTFREKGQELLVTYNPETRKVIDFFISSDDSSGATTDTAHLLEVGNLSENDSRYNIEFVKTIKDPTVYTGVKITQN